jgi:hypothetical protein
MNLSAPARIHRRPDKFAAPAKIWHHGFAPTGQRMNLQSTHDEVKFPTTVP